MTLENNLTRLPRPYDPALGMDVLSAVPWASGPLAELLAGTAGCSPYLGGLIRREADWLEGAVQDAEGAVAAVLADLGEVGPDALASALRQAKRRVALMAGLADLGGAWTLEQVTGALTDLADRACDLALKAALAHEIRRGKLPGATEDSLQDAGGMAVFAMGKMGARELNYSSDIDLICLFDESRYDPSDYHEARSAFVRATRKMSSTLNDLTGEGYVFRTDLRLRPDPSVTPVCMAMEAAERYYESLGRTWERAAWIKARPCAGDLVAGAAFQKTLRPFVWRRHLDFAAIDDAHNMRLAYREHKGVGGPITLTGHNMKLGRGGIREIEFFTQTRQLIAGGRDADLRVRGTVDGLAQLAGKGWIPQEVAEVLTDRYRQHREVEHRLQMVADAQTHSLPETPDGFDRLAAMMGTDADSLRSDLRQRLSEVHDLTEDFFAPGQSPTTDAEPPEVAKITSRWKTYPALRSERAVEIFKRLRPEIMTRMAEASRPDEALLAFDGFLEGLPAGVQLFSLFEANPQLVDLLIDIVSVSPDLGRYLARNSGVFDAVIGGDFFSDWPGLTTLVAELTVRLGAEADYERKLDAARRWGKEWHFRIGVHLLRGLIDAGEAGRQYADLAEASLRGLLPVVEAQFAERHGPVPGRGAIVLGMGSLGAGRLHPRSDLDVIVIYDPAGVEMSDGRRPLNVRTYYARLTQALVTAVTAPMAEGRLYELDMRLRPSGNQGPVAVSIDSFRNYQANEAWLWEHLALTRARVVAGPDDLGATVDQIRQEILSTPRDAAPVLAEVATMRSRIAAAKGQGDAWDPKLGRGRLQDIELVTQAGALIAGQPHRDVAGALAAAVACGWMSGAQADHLRATYDLCWGLQTGSRLISANMIAPDALGAGGAGFLTRMTASTGLDGLQARLSEMSAKATSMIDELVGQDDADEGRPTD
ncbi:glutamine-synthetase adenylyltransferase [Pseudoprimorskyibacter insulae]|uniref:Bifunctional glutamine synthetase adenylyltransferase/adenylyl-removing enzyme n=1 Tax=Pseudoprimorskyibacter insulae TaxID=1695997 RepID=A0A2R8AXG0_9RHOB|nr:glutamine-synthetase adenylyltransferase [Pseudoprimorskyibacter insulae]SPF80690.1 Bifunctional glutamine synthetase adenylyltransferase/adenylyl-removing enzyme [Pseudoprimorskyibacter insulae]